MDNLLVISLINSICLEWNGMGMLDSSFAVFCDGVGSNTSLRALDLRNNQISHDSIIELAASLKRNVHLKALGELSDRCFLLHVQIKRALLL